MTRLLARLPLLRRLYARGFGDGWDACRECLACNNERGS